MRTTLNLNYIAEMKLIEIIYKTNNLLFKQEKINALKLELETRKEELNILNENSNEDGRGNMKQIFARENVI